MSCSGPISRRAATLCVPIARWMLPFGSPGTTPSFTTSASALSSVTMLITTSRPRHASTIEPATFAPAFSRSAHFARVRL